MEKGQSGNPHGRPKIPDDIKQSRELNRLELERLFNLLLHKTIGELRDLTNSDDTPSFMAAAAQVMLKAQTFGDQHRLEFFLQRIIGKVKDEVDVSFVKPFIIRKKDGEEIVLGAERKVADTETT